MAVSIWAVVCMDIWADMTFQAAWGIQAAASAVPLEWAAAEATGSDIRML